MRVRACSRDADCFILAAWGPKNTACETFVCNENVIFPKLLWPSPAIKAGAGYARPMQALALASRALPDLDSAILRNKKGRAFRHDLINHLFLLLPRMVASGLAACFMKAEGLMPTMFLNCLEK